MYMASLERTMAQLCSRIWFPKDGDANTSFFHRQAGFRKTKNFVPKLVKDDQIYTKQEDKYGIVYNYFNNLLGSLFHRSTSLNLDFFHTQNLELLELDTPISETEIWTTIKDLPADVPQVLMDSLADFIRHVG
jgi:hypothetical protein